MGTVIIFGATGTVGAYTAVYLKECGYDVVASGRRKSDGGFFASKGMRYIPVDVCRREDFYALPLSGVDFVVNLSGMLPARMKGFDPQKYVDINMTGALNILEYCVKAKASRVVFTQSISDVAHLCGSPVPIPSDAPSAFPLDNDHSVYSITKTAACHLLEHYSAHYGFRHFILRLPNIYLYHPNPYYYLDGEKKMQGYRRMIRMAMCGDEIQVWGNPSLVRDIVYVKDCCQMVEKCLSADNPVSGMYNVGTGVGTSMEDQVKGIVEIFSSPGKRSRITYDPSKPDSVEYVFDISKAIKELGYRPKYGYLDYLKDFKQEMQEQNFALLWGKEVE